MFRSFPWGWSELEGIAARSDFDLKQHETHSGKNLKYFDQEANEHYWPYVVEPALGVDRAALAILVDAYEEEPDPSGKEGDGYHLELPTAWLLQHRKKIADGLIIIKVTASLGRIAGLPIPSWCAPCAQPCAESVIFSHPLCICCPRKAQPWCACVVAQRVPAVHTRRRR